MSTNFATNRKDWTTPRIGPAPGSKPARSTAHTKAKRLTTSERTAADQSAAIMGMPKAVPAAGAQDVNPQGNELASALDRITQSANTQPGQQGDDAATALAKARGSFGQAGAVDRSQPIQLEQSDPGQRVAEKPLPHRPLPTAPEAPSAEVIKAQAHQEVADTYGKPKWWQRALEIAAGGLAAYGATPAGQDGAAAFARGGMAAGDFRKAEEDKLFKERLGVAEHDYQGQRQQYSDQLQQRQILEGQEQSDEQRRLMEQEREHQRQMDVAQLKLQAMEHQQRLAQQQQALEQRAQQAQMQSNLALYRINQMSRDRAMTTKLAGQQRAISAELQAYGTQLKSATQRLGYLMPDSPEYANTMQQIAELQGKQQDAIQRMQGLTPDGYGMPASGTPQAAMIKAHPQMQALGDQLKREVQAGRMSRDEAKALLAQRWAMLNPGQGMDISQIAGMGDQDYGSDY